MNTNSLKTFIAVCEHAGFSAAAKELGYTQSTVSSQIKQLEAELQVRLFDRYYHRVSLTEEGILVLQQARNILNAQEKMLASLKFGERIEGEIRLAMSSSICNRYFKEDFLQFRRKYPGIRAEIKEGGTEQMFNMLRKNEADIVFTLDRHIYDSDFIICAEQEEQAHFIAATNHPLAKRRLTLQELCGNEFVLTERKMSYRAILDEALALQIHGNSSDSGNREPNSDLRVGEKKQSALLSAGFRYGGLCADRAGDTIAGGGLHGDSLDTASDS